MSGMAGRLRLVVGLDDTGRCALREHFNSQLHRVLQLIPGDAPEEGIVYVLNPGGGVVQGDDLQAEICVGPGAHAIVTAPSSTKVYRAERGVASSRTRLRVERGGILEYLPEPVIPYAGARFIEELDLDVADGGCAMAWEILAPGRSASGESLRYERLDLRLRVRDAGRMVLLERGSIVPSEGVSGPVVLSHFSAYGILIVVGGDSPRVESVLRGAIGGRFAGVTRLRGRGTMMKVLSSETREIQELFGRAREAVGPVLSSRPATKVRRT